MDFGPILVILDLDLGHLGPIPGSEPGSGPFRAYFCLFRGFGNWILAIMDLFRGSGPGSGPYRTYFFWQF